MRLHTPAPKASPCEPHELSPPTQLPFDWPPRIHPGPDFTLQTPAGKLQFKENAWLPRSRTWQKPILIHRDTAFQIPTALAETAPEYYERLGVAAIINSLSLCSAEGGQTTPHVIKTD